MKRMSIVLATVAVVVFNGVTNAHPGHGSAVDSVAVSPGHYLLEPSHVPTTIAGIATFLAIAWMLRVVFRRVRLVEHSQET